MCISGALRTTPTEAMNVFSDLLPIEAAPVRLHKVSEWMVINHGPTNFLRRSCLLVKTVHCISTTDFTADFNRNLLRQNNTGSILFYTDGSKLNNRVDGGVYTSNWHSQTTLRALEPVTTKF